MGEKENFVFVAKNPFPAEKNPGWKCIYSGKLEMFPGLAEMAYGTSLSLPLV